MAVFAEKATLTRSGPNRAARWARRSAAGALAGLLGLSLLACSERQPEVRSPLPAPAEVVVVTPAAAPAATTAATAADAAASTSVPDAASVLGTSTATKQDPTAGRANKTMSRIEESTAMPMPGQNNDHSAPLPPAKRASSP